MEMEDALAKKVAQLRAYSGSVKRRNSMYCDIAKIHDRNAAKSLGALHKAPAPGKKLQKIGFIMLWVPEPTGVTCAIGGPMILAGRYLDKTYNGATIEDIGQQTRATSSSISDFKNSLL
ncbi:MAG: hypothetical protein ACE5R3_01945 [Nitrosopumilaceae archaeon]